MSNIIEKTQNVFMLSGQGAQYYFMGKDLFDHQPIFRKWMSSLDNIIKDILGQSVIDIIYDTSKKKSNVFDGTLHTNLAIFIIEYAMVMTLIESGIKPDYLLGSSFGEHVVCAISEVLSLEDSIRLTIKLSELIDSMCPAGGMLAILDNPELYNDTSIIHENSELASISFHSHFVVSGHKDGLSKIIELLKGKNILYQMLPVSRAFHSKLIDPMDSLFKDYLMKLNFKKPSIPLISCYTTGVVSEISKSYFWDVIRSPIWFQRTIQSFEDEHDNNNQAYRYIDVGPAGTLATFVKYNLSADSRSDIFPILTPFSNDSNNFQKLFNRCFQCKI